MKKLLTVHWRVGGRSAVGASPISAIYERSDLAAYFARRHAANERVVPVSLTYTPDAERYPRADVSFVVIRTASELGSAGNQVGKAAIKLPRSDNSCLDDLRRTQLVRGRP